MKRIKPLYYMIVIPFFFSMVCLGTLYGASVTMQHEGTLQNGRERPVVKDPVNMNGRQIEFTPQKSRDKRGSGMQSDAGNPLVEMERYKPYREGEGERKIK